MSSLNPESRVTWKVPKHNIKSLFKKKKKKLLLLYPLSPHLLQPFEYLPINKILSSIYIHTGIPRGSHNTPQIPSQISFKRNGPDETMHSVFGPDTLPEFSVLAREQIYCFCDFILRFLCHFSYCNVSEKSHTDQTRFGLVIEWPRRNLPSPTSRSPQLLKVPCCTKIQIAQNVRGRELFCISKVNQSKVTPQSLFVLVLRKSILKNRNTKTKIFHL